MKSDRPAEPKAYTPTLAGLEDGQIRAETHCACGRLLYVIYQRGDVVGLVMLPVPHECDRPRYARSLHMVMHISDLDEEGVRKLENATGHPFMDQWRARPDKS